MGFLNSKRKQNETKWEEAAGKVKNKGKSGMMTAKEYAKWLKAQGLIDAPLPPAKQKRGGKWGRR